MDSSFAVDGGRRARKSGTGSFQPRAFRGSPRDPMDGKPSSSFSAAVVFNGSDGGVGASALCWMVLRKW